MRKMLSVVLMVVLVSTMVLGMVGCGKKEEPTPPPVVEVPEVEEVEEVVEVVEVSLEDIVNTLKVTYGSNYLVTQELEEEVFSELIGVNTADYMEYYAAIAEDVTNVDTLFVVKTGEENKEGIVTAFEGYKDVLVNDPTQTPENLAILEQSVILEYDEHVVFMVFSNLPESYNVEGVETEIIEEEVDLQHFGVSALDVLFEIGYNLPEIVEPVEVTDPAAIVTPDVETTEPVIEPVAPEVDSEPTENDFE